MDNENTTTGDLTAMLSNINSPERRTSDGEKVQRETLKIKKLRKIMDRARKP